MTKHNHVVLKPGLQKFRYAGRGRLEKPQMWYTYPSGQPWWELRNTDCQLPGGHEDCSDFRCDQGLY